MPLSSYTSQGSILFSLYAAIAMIGVVGAVAMNIMKGPVHAMSQVTHRTLAENQMMASGKLALMMAAQQVGDCDGDGRIEPVAWVEPGSMPAPANGGLLPASIGAALHDPWKNAYGYCVWDHGMVQLHSGCGTPAKRLKGSDVPANPVIAVISAGPDRFFQTACHAEGEGEYLVRGAASDDLILSYSFAEAITLSGGLWDLKADDAQTATINKNLSVTDIVGQEQLFFDTATRALSLGSGGTGVLPNIKTDYIQNLTANASIEFLSNIKMGNASLSGDVDAAGKMSAGTADISTNAANAVAAIVTSSGSDGVGLQASGTSKAIEAKGLVDMTGHKIINLAEPVDDQDATTKKFVEDLMKEGPQKIICESFVSSGCSGAATQSLDRTNLGACKKACEEAGVQCCTATFPFLTSNPNAQLSSCIGYNAPSQPSGIRAVVAGLLGTVSAYCYLQ